MTTTDTRMQPKLSGPGTAIAMVVEFIRRPKESRGNSYGSVLHKRWIGWVMDYLFTIALAVCLYTSASAQDSWQTVEGRQALLNFENATRVQLQQRREGETTLEQSYWILDDGSNIYFHVTWLGPRWVLTNRGDKLEEVFNRAFPNAELEEIGEPFLNRERGTQGQAQWLRYRDQGSHCVLIRQYGWDDDSQINSASVPLGNRVAIAFHCADLKLSNSQIGQLFERIDF